MALPLRVVPARDLPSGLPGWLDEALAREAQRAYLAWTGTAPGRRYSDLVEPGVDQDPWASQKDAARRQRGLLHFGAFAAQDLRELAKRFKAGRLTPSGLAAAADQVVRVSGLAAAQIGMGREDVWSDPETVDRLDQLYRDREAGRMQFLVREADEDDTFATTGRVAAWNAQADAGAIHAAGQVGGAARIGDDGVRWVMEAGETHCGRCPRYAKTYPDLETLLRATGGYPGASKSECDGNCKCHIEAQRVTSAYKDTTDSLVRRVPVSPFAPTPQRRAPVPPPRPSYDPRGPETLAMEQQAAPYKAYRDSQSEAAAALSASGAARAALVKHGSRAVKARKGESMEDAEARHRAREAELRVVDAAAYDRHQAARMAAAQARRAAIAAQPAESAAIKTWQDAQWPPRANAAELPSLDEVTSGEAQRVLAAEVEAAAEAIADDPRAQKLRRVAAAAKVEADRLDLKAVHVSIVQYAGRASRALQRAQRLERESRRHERALADRALGLTVEDGAEVELVPVHVVGDTAVEDRRIDNWGDARMVTERRMAAEWLKGHISQRVVGPALRWSVEPTVTGGNGRASAGAHMKTGKGSYDVAAATIIHEIGHRIEDQLPDVNDRMYGWLDRRTANKPTRWLGPGYDSWEVYRDGGFIRPYVGKEYRTASGHRIHSEALSMGLQEMYTDPVGFARADPEHFLLTRAVMRGELR